MSRSIHDNVIVGHTVDGERQSIVLRTEYRGAAPPVERTTVAFEGVEAYRFAEHILDGQNILFSIDEEDVNSFLAGYADEFDRRHGWPGFCTGSVDDAREHLATTGHAAS